MTQSPPEDAASIPVPADLSAESGRDLYRRVADRIHDGQARIVLDLAGVTSIDSLGSAWLARALRYGQRHRANVELVGATGKVGRFLELVDPQRMAEGSAPPRRRGLFEEIGRKFFAVVGEARDAGELLIDAVYWTVVGPLEGRGFRWGALIDELDRMGAKAVAIVFLVNYLLGLIIAALSAVQLRAFGAEIFVADLVVIAFARELAPVMTAVVVSARSGAAIAAELATMKVQEEIDALRAMGFDPAKFLVAPRVLALMIAMPCLSLLALVAGTLGGLHLGTIFMDFSRSQWLNETFYAVTIGDITLGLWKSLAFGIVIVLIGCHNGLRVRGGARGVGLATTRAVVMDIFCIIVIDLIFALPDFIG